jgi:hypothetical protein
MTVQNGCKFVVLLNKNLAPGVALNAVAHASLGLSALLANGQKEAMRLLDFKDGDGQIHPNISALSLIVLRGTSGNIRSLRNDARSAGIPCVDFTSSMTGGSYEEQLERTLTTPEAELDYYCVVLFGKLEDLNPLTKKFSLYK